MPVEEQAPILGLTTEEARVRRRSGEANTAVGGTSRTYATILRTNVFSFYNSILFVIGIALLSLGRYSDALTSVGLGLVNAVISAAQEIRAKRKLDRLQLLDQAVAREASRTGPIDGPATSARPGCHRLCSRRSSSGPASHPRTSKAITTPPLQLLLPRAPQQYVIVVVGAGAGRATAGVPADALPLWTPRRAHADA